MQNLDDFFKNNLKKHEIKPSADAWKKIASSGALTREERKVVALWSASNLRKYAAAIALFISSAAAWYYFTGSAVQPEDQSSLYAETHPTDKINDDSSSSHATDTLHLQKSPEILPQEEGSSKPTPIRPTSTKKHRREKPFKLDRAELQYAMLEPVNLKPLRSEHSVGIQLPAVHISTSFQDRSDDRFTVSPEELLYAAEQLDEEELKSETNDLNSLKNRLLNRAKSKLNDWAETAVQPVRQFAAISEIEIEY